MNTKNTKSIYINISKFKGVLCMQRLRVILEFSKNKAEDLELYGELIRYSNPGAHVKDILKGLSPLPTLSTNNKEKE